MIIILHSNSFKWLSQLGLLNMPTVSLQRGKTPGYDGKQSDSEALVMLEFWGRQSASSLPSLPFWLGVVAPDRVLSMGQIELFNI